MWSQRSLCKETNLRRALSLTWIPLLLVCIVLYWCQSYDQTQHESAFRVSASTAAMQPCSLGAPFGGAVCSSISVKTRRLDDVLDAPLFQAFISIFAVASLNLFAVLNDIQNGVHLSLTCWLALCLALLQRLSWH